MKKTVLVFPGVGAQYTGMGKGFYENFSVVRETFEEASDATGENMVDLCFSPSEEKRLNRLEYSQLGLVTTSMATYRVFKQEVGLPVHYAIGHSLGEISALCSAGVIAFPDALRIVQQRGNLINETIAALRGTMAWVINLDGSVVESICRNFSREGKSVFVSAYDSPQQTSISGPADAIREVAGQLEAEGAIVYPLKMSGPFHSPLMQEAARRMETVLAGFSYQTPAYPVIANQDALPYTDPASVIRNLSLQLVRPVRWKPCLDYVVGQGVNTAVEVGPKNVLKFLIEKSTDRVEAFPLDTVKDLERIREAFVIHPDAYLSILARCLKAAVTTRNFNDDGEAYRKHVIIPYKKLEQLYQSLAAEGKRPTERQIRESIEVAGSILAAKQVPLPERQSKLDQVLAGKVVRSAGL